MSGLRRIADRLRASKRDVPVRVASAAVDGVDAAARAAAPVRTGALRDSIDVRSDGAVVAVTVGVDYAPYVDMDPDYTAALDAAVREVRDAS